MNSQLTFEELATPKLLKKEKFAQQEEDVLIFFRSILGAELPKHCSISIRKNKVNNSLIASFPASPFRLLPSNIFLCRMLHPRSATVLEFNEVFAAMIQAQGIPAALLTDGFYRVDFDLCTKAKDQWASIFPLFINNALNVDAFACCSKYIECSDAKKCVHSDYARAISCQYRKNLEAGNLFYGVNQNT